jgi:hypothetical protein
MICKIALNQPYAIDRVALGMTLPDRQAARDCEVMLSKLKRSDLR